MDFGGLNWSMLTIIGAAVLAVVIAFAAPRNRSSRERIRESEEATHRVYDAEEAERRSGVSDKGP